MDNQQEGSLQTLHTSESGYRRRGHAIHKQVYEKAMQREIDDKCLRSNVRKPKSKVLHLALQVGLGKEGRHAKSLIR